MKPKDTNVPLRDRDLVVEGLAGMDMQIHVVAVAKRRDVKPVEVEVGVFNEPIVQGHVNRIASSHAPHRRNVRSVVQHPVEVMTVYRIRGRGCDEIDIQPSVVALNRWRVFQQWMDVVSARCEWNHEYDDRNSQPHGGKGDSHRRQRSVTGRTSSAVQWMVFSPITACGTVSLEVARPIRSVTLVMTARVTWRTRSPQILLSVPVPKPQSNYRFYRLLEAFASLRSHMISSWRKGPTEG